MRKRILVKAPALSRSGYGVQSRFAIQALRSREDIFEIFIINISWGKTGHVIEETEEISFIKSTLLKTAQYVGSNGQFDISLQITVPNEFEKIAPVNIGYTAGIETTKVAGPWLEKTNAFMDKLIVVSEHSQKVFEQTTYDVTDEAGNEIKGWGLRVPITTVNYPVRDFAPEPVDINLTTDQNFLVVSQWGPRKNLENTIGWFVQNFKDNENVGLVVKTNIVGDSIIDRMMTSRRLEALVSTVGEHKCKVYLLHGELSQNELTWLYQHPTMKALINIGHGEGYGLPLFEAAYNGLSLITTTWSGQMDFICKKNKKGKRVPRINRVEFDLNQVQKEAVWPGIIEADAKWCFAREASYKRSLSAALEKESHFKKEAGTLQTHILENFTAEKIYKDFVDAIVDPMELSAETEAWNKELADIEMI
jgi:hypothetical protein|tara:strand:+ start:342 stop:1604 length:1263 start_codon:yes stop_codon:yes gene_type:complete